MQGRYRLTESTMAVVALDSHHTSITIPADAILDLEGKPFNGDRLMEVLWEGQRVLMFTADLKASTVPA